MREREREKTKMLQEILSDECKIVGIISTFKHEI